MSASESSIDEPGTPSDNSEHDAQPRRNVVVRALTSLKGWQAIPAAVITLYFFLGIFGPSLAPFDPVAENPEAHNCPPLAINALTTSDSLSDRSSDCRAINILGTDEVGRDIFSRLLHGARTSLLVVLSSVFVGTLVGLAIGVLVNGYGRKSRLVAYAIFGLTVVPFAVLVFGHLGSTIWIFIVWEASNAWPALNAWIAVMTLFTSSTVLTFALVAVAYQYDDTCRRSWFSEVYFDNALFGFYQQLRRQIGVLAPWIVLAAIVNAALAFVFLHSGTGSLFLSPAIAWSLPWESEFEHIGILSSFVPMVLFPIGFVTFGAFWFARHIQSRFAASSDVSLGSPQSVADGADELFAEEADHFESRSFENDVDDAANESGSRLKRWPWMTIAIAAVVAAAVVRFGAAEAVPTVRVLAQESGGSYESARAKFLRELDEAWDCAREIDERISELEVDSFEIEVSERCRGLYFEYRNAPYQRHTINYALRFLVRTLTLALVVSIASAFLWTVGSVSSRAVRMMVGVFVVLVAMVGLTITFGYVGWYQVVIGWLDSLDSTSNKHYAVERALIMVRDFGVAMGVSYLTIAMTKPILRFPKTVPTRDVLSKWGSFFIPCVSLILGLLILLHYPFPTRFIFDDEFLYRIVDPRLGGDSTHADPLDWLWTYWIASIGYAAVVSGFFAAAIWGFRRYVRSDVNGVDSMPVSRDNPSLGGGSI